MADGERVFAVCHEKKQIMAIGHTSWASMELPIKERLEIYAPGRDAGKDQYNFILQQFGDVDALIVESEALALNYKRVPGYWGGVS